MRPKLIKVIEDIHMGLEHRGLAEVLKKQAKIRVDQMGSDELVVCVNKAKTAAKLLGSAGMVLGYIRMPAGSYLTISALKKVADTFGGQGFSSTEGIRKALAVVLGDQSGKIAISA